MVVIPAKAEILMAVFILHWEPALWFSLKQNRLENESLKSPQPPFDKGGQGGFVGLREPLNLFGLET